MAECKTSAAVVKLLELFDFVLIAGKGKDQDQGIQVHSRQGKTLKEWYESLDHHKRIRTSV